MKKINISEEVMQWYFTNNNDTPAHVQLMEYIRKIAVMVAKTELEIIPLSEKLDFVESKDHVIASACVVDQLKLYAARGIIYDDETVRRMALEKGAILITDPFTPDIKVYTVTDKMKRRQNIALSALHKHALIDKECSEKRIVRYR